MRDLEACQAEVFRRSERRIEKRKRRRRWLLTACLPAALLAVTALIPRPPLPPVEPTPGISTTETMGPPEDEVNSIVLCAVRVDVSGDGEARSYGEAERLARIWDVLNSGTFQAQSQSRATEPAPEETEGASREEDPHQDRIQGGYTITVSMNDGSVIVYYLEDAALENRTTDGISLLTRQQLRQLLLLLEIPHPPAQ